MRSEVKRDLTLKALALAIRFLRNKFQPAKQTSTITEKITVIHQDGRTEEIDCKQVQRKIK